MCWDQKSTQYQCFIFSMPHLKKLIALDEPGTFHFTRDPTLPYCHVYLKTQNLLIYVLRLVNLLNLCRDGNYRKGLSVADSVCLCNGSLFQEFHNLPSFQHFMRTLISTTGMNDINWSKVYYSLSSLIMQVCLNTAARIIFWKF